MDNRKSISIIIPNYNCRQLLADNLPCTYNTVNDADIIYEIIVVDDGSSDGSAEFIKSKYPQVILLVNPEQKGIFYSCNRGIGIAQHELIMLLKPEIILSPGYFDNLWKYFLRWDTFGVMGRIINTENEKPIDAAHVPKLYGCKLKTDYTYYTKNKADRLLTYYLSGGNALMSNEMLKKLGGFYEIFSDFNCGAKELGVRALRLKWKCYYEHFAVCQQKHPVALKKDFEYYSGLYYLHTIHLNGYWLAAWHLQIIITDLIPKTLSGNGWIWQCYLNVFKKKAAINQHKLEIKNLMYNQDSVMTVSMAVKKIRAFVKSKNSIRFNSGF